MNLYHSIAHLLIGLWGLTPYTSYSVSKTYALVVGLVYLLLAILGFLGIDPGGSSRSTARTTSCTS